MLAFWTMQDQFHPPIWLKLKQPLSLSSLYCTEMKCQRLMDLSEGNDINVPGSSSIPTSMFLNLPRSAWGKAWLALFPADYISAKLLANSCWTNLDWTEVSPPAIRFQMRYSLGTALSWDFLSHFFNISGKKKKKIIKQPARASRLYVNTDIA